MGRALDWKYTVLAYLLNMVMLFPPLLLKRQIASTNSHQWKQ